MFKKALLSSVMLLGGAMLLITVSVDGAAQEAAGQPEDTVALTMAKAVHASSFMVAAANPHASQVGYDVLKAGGNAIDALVAVQAMLNLVEPQSSGIGGGAFLLYYDAASKTLTSFDGREVAPMAARPDYFLEPDGEPMDWWDSVIGGRSVGVPGTLRLMETVHARYGSRDWAKLLQPTIELARGGFEVSERLAGAIASAQERSLDKFEEARAYFFNRDGTPKEVGTVLINADFADTLDLIAQKGASPFYDGEIGADLVAAVNGDTDNPNPMSVADLRAYEVIERAPICVDYRGHKVCGMGPPTSGGLTVGQMLKMLEHFDLPGMGYGVDAVHLFTEAGKLAYADRAMYMADSDFVRVPAKGLLDDGYMTVRAQQIDIDQASEGVAHGNPPWRDAARWSPDRQIERPGTSHFSIIDAAGNAVSMTTTIETGFGSRIMVRGFLLNNELTDFSRTPEEDGRMIANRVEPGKRPRSSMAPTMVMAADGSPSFLIGSPGGSRIINYLAKTLVATLDWGMDVQAAINLGHFVNRNGATDLEVGTEAAALEEALAARGHEINIRDLNSGLHGIQITDQGLIGGADPRREGVVLGD